MCHMATFQGTPSCWLCLLSLSVKVSFLSIRSIPVPVLAPSNMLPTVSSEDWSFREYEGVPDIRVPSGVYPR